MLAVTSGLWEGRWAVLTLPLLPPEQGQLHPLLQAAPRWAHAHRGRRGQHAHHLGPGLTHTSHQGGADVLCPCLLCPGHQP